MREYYEAFADYTTMMGRVEQLVVRAADAVRGVLAGVEHGIVERTGDPPLLRPPFPRIEWLPSLTRAIGTDVLSMKVEALAAAAKQAGIQHVDTMSRPKLMDELFQSHVESKIEEPTFVVD